ncbi:hypothetical protein [Nesterenkonia muleiensis]|uniref:hypothetical protein n=1 Tax=Nesterenkonia muleiensis TaxID=2282648 RepID=UPI000E708EFD|nr:hypothetical protein [Nesterenkonia muleiensis]
MSEPTHPDSSAPEPSQSNSVEADQTETVEDSAPAQEQSVDASEGPSSEESSQPPESPAPLKSATSADSADEARESSDQTDDELQDQHDSASPEHGQTSSQDENDAEHSAEQQDQSQLTAQAEPPDRRTGVAPITDVPSGPEKGLGGFLDTLDERAKNWWSTYRIRQARKKAMTAKAASAQPADAPAGDSPEQPEPATTPTGAPARHRARHSSSGPAPLASPSDSPRIGLPKPPPVEQRPADQLFTGAIPILETGEDGPPPPADETPRTPEAAQADDPAEQTTVLPAYRGDQSVQPGFPVARRELDDQRRRTVIAQKAAAIEKATTEPAPLPYGGSGYIGAHYPPQSPEFADDEEDLYTYIPPYNLPSRDADPEPTRWDLARRVFVSLGALASVLSTIWMLGWFGSREENPAIPSQNGLQEVHAEGWFSGEHALLSPDHNWYWIWPLITLTLVAHAIYQWTGSQHSTPRQQRSGWLVGTASCLMLVMTTALHAGIFTLALLSAAVIAGVLTQAIRQFNLYTARSDTERQLTDDVVGLFYGFALIQTMSALSVWLTHRGWEVPGVSATFWAMVGLLLCIWTAAFYSMTERGRITIALGLAWGLFWLVFPRILGEVTSVWIALAAAMGAFIVILCTQSRRYRINHAERRAAMGRPLEDII